MRPGLLAAIVLLFSIVEPRFRTLDNALNILLQISMEALIACGMTMVILAGRPRPLGWATAALSGVILV